MSNKRTKNAEINEQRSRKRSLPINSPNEVNKKKNDGPARRYKVLLTCLICNGAAHGYNFDAISCESCKAFFRRNAIRPLEKLKCRGNGHCDVAYNIKKRCKKCRLEKCIKSGMRKEWILSDKEKEEKRLKIEENRRLRQAQDNHQGNRPLVKRDSKIDDDFSLDSLTCLSEPFLTDTDWMNIQSIQNCYVESVKLNQIAGILCYPSTQPIESTLELFRIPLYISSMRLVTFIRQITEFKQLDITEQIHLVKLNLLAICFFHSMFIFDPRTNSYHEQDTTDPLFSENDWIKTLNMKFHLKMKQLRNDLLDIFQMDNVIIKLFFIILLFSQQITLNQSSQCTLTDINSLNISKAQNVFTDLVYRYCVNQYGLSQAPILFMRYVNKIMEIQQLVDEIKYTIHDYMDTTELSPLIQSLVM